MGNVVETNPSNASEQEFHGEYRHIVPIFMEIVIEVKSIEASD